MVVKISETGMAIKKQEFYEGAALHLVARAGQGSAPCKSFVADKIAQ